MFVIFFLILYCGRGTNPSHAYIIIYIAAAVFREWRKWRRMGMC